MWKDFAHRFDGILVRLARHKDLVDREASSIDIAEARAWRLRTEEDTEKCEKQRRNCQLQDSITWLAIEDTHQEDKLYRLAQRWHNGTCKWVQGNSRMIAWLSESDDEPVLWIKGIPGAGMSECNLDSLVLKY